MADRHLSGAHDARKSTYLLEYRAPFGPLPWAVVPTRPIRWALAVLALAAFALVRCQAGGIAIERALIMAAVVGVLAAYGPAIAAAVGDVLASVGEVLS